MQTNDQHVIPAEGGHLARGYCWCQPKVDTETDDGTRVYDHKRYNDAQPEGAAWKVVGHGETLPA